MKIIPTVTTKTESIIFLTYEQALSHIWSVFGIPECDCKFTENCICGFTCSIEGGQMKSFNIFYDKISFEVEGNIRFWPIQKYTCNISLDEAQQLLEHLRK